MTAVQETVTKNVEQSKELCNVSSIAAKLALNVNTVKTSFPLGVNDSIVTSESNGNFVVHLFRPSQKQLTSSDAEIWSTHGYQRVPEDNLSITERNNQLLNLLNNERPDPLISCESVSRKVTEKTIAADLKNVKKASTDEFFSKKKESPTKKTTSGITNMFQKKPKPETPKEVKVEQKTKPESLKQVKTEEIETSKPVKTEEKTKSESLKQAKTEEKTKSESSKQAKTEEKTKPESSKQAKTEEKTKPSLFKVKTEAESTKTAEKSELKTKTEVKKDNKTSNSPRFESSEDEEKIPKGKTVSKTVKKTTETNSKKTDNAKRKRKEQMSDEDDEEKKSRNKKLKRVAILDSESEDDENNPQHDSIDEMDISETPDVVTEEASPRETKNKKQTKKTLSSKKNNKPKETSRKKPDEDTQEDEAKRVKVVKSSENGKTNQRRRRRVLKEVTHTFKSDDGFLETKVVKEMVSETDSESECSAPTKSTTKTASVASTPAPRGQASLLSFFKKN